MEILENLDCYGLEGQGCLKAKVMMDTSNETMIISRDL